MKTSIFKSLYVQVLTATSDRYSAGPFLPGTGRANETAGDAFVKLIKMVIARLSSVPS
ncbi:hypothetical protein MJ579_27240 [Klebsiella pneumoniae]|nr:hypothetical protein MJ579_27240 [Klebsiella pneumoniae]